MKETQKQKTWLAWDVCYSSLVRVHGVTCRETVVLIDLSNNWESCIIEIIESETGIFSSRLCGKLRPDQADLMKRCRTKYDGHATEIINVWGYTSITPYVFATSCLIKHTDSFSVAFYRRGVSESASDLFCNHTAVTCYFCTRSFLSGDTPCHRLKTTHVGNYGFWGITQHITFFGRRFGTSCLFCLGHIWTTLYLKN